MPCSLCTVTAPHGLAIWIRLYLSVYILVVDPDNYTISDLLNENTSPYIHLGWWLTSIHLYTPKSELGSSMYTFLFFFFGSLRPGKLSASSSMSLFHCLILFFLSLSAYHSWSVSPLLPCLLFFSEVRISFYVRHPSWKTCREMMTPWEKNQLFIHLGVATRWSRKSWRHTPESVHVWSTIYLWVH